MNFFLAGSYIKHLFLATDLHGLHSPFLDDFYRSVIKVKNPTFDDFLILEERKKLMKESRVIAINDLGAGSKVYNKAERPISALARSSLTPIKFSRFLTRCIAYNNSKTVLELGTSLGINAAYLGKAIEEKGKLYTLEGCENTILEAEKTLERLGLSNVEIIKGDIDLTLPLLLKLKRPKLDLVYLDANHRYDPSVNYVNQICKYCHNKSIIILDDIHWSAEMNKAWRQLCRDDRFSLKIDLFEAGLLFLDPALNKEEIRLLF